MDNKCCQQSEELRPAWRSEGEIWSDITFYK